MAGGGVPFIGDVAAGFSTVAGRLNVIEDQIAAISGGVPPFPISDITGLQTALDGKQGLDADLTALAALTGTNTLYYRSADAVWSPVVIGANLTFSGGTLSATGGGGGISPPFAISDTTGLQAALDAKQPLDADLTSIAALTTTTFGRNQLTYVDASAAKTALSLVKGDVGLANVDNTSDLGKPISTATQTALGGKQPLDGDLTAIAALTTTAFGRARLTDADASAAKSALSLTKADVGLGNVDNTSDANKPVSTAQQTALDGKQPLDSDLTAIAALTTTTFGRARLTDADAAAAKTALVLTKADVGLANVDNTSDANKPVSTAQQTALNLKANKTGDTLTGTSVNGVTLTTGGAATSYLNAAGAYTTPAGGGGGGAAWGDITGTLSAQTDLQSELDAKAEEAEIAAARGGRSTLNRRLNTLSTVCSPSSIPIAVGRWYDGSFHAANPGTLAGAANRCDLGLFFSSTPLRADRVAIAVSGAVASSLAKIVIYDSDDQGVPDNLIYESANIDCSTVGGKEQTIDLMFDANRIYWLGVRHSSTATLRSIVGTSGLNMGMSSSNSSTQLGTLRRTVTFASAAPDPWVYDEAEAVFALSPSVRLRARSLT